MHRGVGPDSQQSIPGLLDGVATGFRLFHPSVRARLVDSGAALLGVGLFLLAWEAAAANLGMGRLVGPTVVFEDIRANFVLAKRLEVFGLGRVGYGDMLFFTARNVVIGVAIGGGVGTLLGLISGRVRLIRAIIDPIVTVLGTVPLVVSAPLFLLWFGIVPVAQILIVSVYAGVMLALFSQRAADNLNPVYEKWAMTMGVSFQARLRSILVPGTVPEILGGFRIALASAWGLETFAEILGAKSGMGQAIKTMTSVSDVPGLLASITLIAITAVIVDALVVALSRSITRWL